jgi:growth hormone secretagogue receptor
MASTTNISTTKGDINQVISEEEMRIFSAILFIVDIALPPAVIAFGLIGNILANLVLRQPQNAKQTTCYYMRGLSMFDCLILSYKVTMRTAINYNPDYMLNLQNGPIVCPTMAFSDCTFGLSNWTVAAMTFDRFVAVRFPLKAAGWCTKRRCRFTILSIVIFCVCLAIPYSIRNLNTSGNVNKEICYFDPEMFPHWYPKTIYILHTSCLFTAPFFTVFVFNISIIWTLIEQKVQTAKSQMDRHQTKAKQEGHITLLLFIVTLIFCITSIPWCMDQWIWDLVIGPRPTGRLKLIRKVGYEIEVFLKCVNPSVNFYVYVVACRKFRQDARAMFSRGLKRVLSINEDHHK